MTMFATYRFTCFCFREGKRDSLGSAPLREKSSNEEPRLVRVPVQASRLKQRKSSTVTSLWQQDGVCGAESKLTTVCVCSCIVSGFFLRRHITTVVAPWTSSQLFHPSTNVKAVLSCVPRDCSP